MKVGRAWAADAAERRRCGGEVVVDGELYEDGAGEAAGCGGWGRVCGDGRGGGEEEVILVVEEDDGLDESDAEEREEVDEGADEADDGEDLSQADDVKRCRGANLLFSALFAASLVFLMRRWREEIRVPDGEREGVGRLDLVRAQGSEAPVVPAMAKALVLVVPKPWDSLQHGGQRNQ